MVNLYTCTFLVEQNTAYSSSTALSRGLAVAGGRVAEILAFSSKAVVSLVRQCSLTFKERFGMREKLLASFSLQSGPTSENQQKNNRISTDKLCME